MLVVSPAGAVIGMSSSHPVSLAAGESAVSYTFETEPLAPGIYTCDLVVCEYRGDVEKRHDFIRRAFSFRVEEDRQYFGRHWEARNWGQVKLAPLLPAQEGSDVWEEKGEGTGQEAQDGSRR